MKKGTVHIILYRWAGRKLFWKIRSDCEECDRSVQCIRELLERDFGNEPITFEVRNWLDDLSGALLRGAWHPPVILLDGARFSQGVVPDAKRLAQAIQARMARSA